MAGRSYGSGEPLPVETSDMDTPSTVAYAEEIEDAVAPLYPAAGPPDPPL